MPAVPNLIEWTFECPCSFHMFREKVLYCSVMVLGVPANATVN